MQSKDKSLMEEPDSTNEQPQTNSHAVTGQRSPSRMDSEQQDEREAHVTHSRTEHPAETTDRLLQEFWEWLKREKIPAHGWITAISSLALLGVTFGQLVVACNNYVESSPLVGYAQKTSDAADRFANAAIGINMGVGGAVTQLGNQVGKLDRQAGATERSAGAATSAASTAKDALSISERAYLQIGGEVLDIPNKRIRITLVNTGRIPPGHIKVTVHESTLDITRLNDARVIEIHWTEDYGEGLPSAGMIVNVNVPRFNEAEIKSSRQQIVITGTITYNDGFPNTKDQVRPFCTSALNGPIPNEITLFPCDSSTELPIAIGIDKYPDPKYRNKT
jgi:hypothetical protein